MANNKKESLAVNTGIGTLTWVKINGNEDTFNGVPTGKYTASLENIDEASAKELQKQLLNFWDNSETKKKAVEEYGEADKPNLGIKLGKGKKADKGWFLSAKTVKSFLDKNGNTQEHIIPIYDGQGNRLQDNLQIWNGSKGMLRLYVTPYMMSENNYGLSLKLQDICVVDLITGGSSNEASPFGTVEGASAYDAMVYNGNLKPVYIDENGVESEDIPF